MTHTVKQNKSLSIAALIMMGSVLLSRVIGVFREMALARFGGTSVEMDAYVTSFIIPEFLNHFLASGFLSLTFIPIFQQHYTRKDYDAAWKSFSNLFILGTLAFCTLIPITQLITPHIVNHLGPHISSPSTALLTIKLTRIILPAQLFFYWGAFFNAVQMAQHRFLLPALAPLVYNTGIIAGGILLGPKLGIEGFAWGVLIGAFAGNVALQLPGAIASGMRFSLQCNLRHPDVKTYIIKTIPLILGVSMTFSTEFFFRYFGSFLSEGATSSVNYALRTMMIIVAVFGQASGVAFFPFLSKLAAEKNYSEMTRLLDNLLHKIALYLIPISIILYIGSRPLIALLFERGKFDTTSTAETASVFCVYLLGAFAYSAAIIIARSFYAMQRMLLPMIISTSIAFCTIPLYIFFSRYTGARGIALVAVIAAIMQYTILYCIWNREYNTLKHIINELLFIIKTLALSCIAALPGYFLYTRLFRSVHIPSSLPLIKELVALTIISAPTLIIVFMLYEIFGLQKIKDSIQGLFKRKKMAG